MLYNETEAVTDLVTCEETYEKLWLYEHFVSKAFQLLLIDLAAKLVEKTSNSNINNMCNETAPSLQSNNKCTNNEDIHPKFMLWITKSAVQPCGNADEWSKMIQANDTVKQWAD